MAYVAQRLVYPWHKGQIGIFTPFIIFTSFIANGVTIVVLLLGKDRWRGDTINTIVMILMDTLATLWGTLFTDAATDTGPIELVPVTRNRPVCVNVSYKSNLVTGIEIHKSRNRMISRIYNTIIIENRISDFIYFDASDQV